MTTFMKGEREFLQRHLSEWPTPEVHDGAEYNGTDIEWQTDKALVKLVPCTGCAKPIGVNVFYAPAIAKCGECAGQSKTAGVGESKIVQAGRTDPSKAANLVDALVNKAFAEAVCPLCAETMELKTVCHNARYGPSRLIGYKNGVSQYENSTGETVMLQCNSCKTTTSYSTTAQMVYRRMNEPKIPASGRPAAEWLLGAREVS